ncbi:MAG: hypothetical protein ACE1ZS_09590, partial [Candidatus Poribacteria bacterium]
GACFTMLSSSMGAACGPAGLQFSRLITHLDNGCMGWNEIDWHRFTGPHFGELSRKGEISAAESRWKF